MPDRLDDLRRQRALISEHLAWIDREIAAASPHAPALPAPENRRGPVPLPVGLGHAPRPVPNATAGAPRDFPEYQTDAAAVERDARRGCLLYAALGFVALFVIAAAIYFFGYRDYPLFSSGKPAAHAPR
ncbi:MAG: hypothetical protein JWM88_2994 [Verrucomicrobia bacterium]|nr:hypothetical protein [Verrucomicrobiota bacterium]